MPHRTDITEGATEDVYFHDANIWVTQDRFTNGVTSFEIRRIAEASVIKGRWLPRNGVLALVGGLVLLPFFLYAGLAIVAASAIFCISHKQEYLLLLIVDEKEIRALVSTDQTYLKQVYDAVVEAIRVRQARKRSGKV